MRNKIFFVVMFVLFVTMLPAQVLGQSIHRFSGSSSGTSSITRQTQPSLQSLYGGEVTTYWPILGDRATCEARSDLLLSVAPGGCQPAVVRSDLLAEQNVPVFCQIDSYKINPLVDVYQLKGISFVGDYPEEVAGVGFHPARAAIRSREQLLGAPLQNNLGYAVVVLKRQPDESKLPEFVNVTLGARIDYLSGNSVGVGKAEFILERISDSQWDNEKYKDSFWNGRYFLRLEEADANYATVSVYQGDQRYVTTRLEKGMQSKEIFVPGFYCQAGLLMDYDGFVTADKRAKLEVSSGGSVDVLEVTEGSWFLDRRCRVKAIDVDENGETGRVVLYCNGKSFTLRTGVKEGSEGNVIIVDGLSVSPVEKDGEYEINLNALSVEDRNGKYVLDINEALFNVNGGEIVNEDGEFVAEGDYTSSDESWFVALRQKLIDYRDGLGGSASDDSQARRYFDSAVEDYLELVDDYPSEKRVQDVNERALGEEGLLAGIELAKDFGDGEVERRLINKYKERYGAEGDYLGRLQELGDVDYSDASQAIEFDDRTRVIRLVDLSEPEDQAFAELRVEGKPLNIEKDESKNLTLGGIAHGQITLDSVGVDEAVLSAYCNVTGTLSSRQRYSLRADGEIKEICELDVSLVQTNTREAAKVRLTPVAQGTQTITNVSVNIGIEKRAIEISPDKAREKIENLNETIAEWEDTSEKLGKVVTGLKGACFATSALLTFKNFVTGLSGEALARQQVMRGENGWAKRCEQMVSAGTYSTVNECYLGEASNIDAEVAAQTNALNKVNSKINEIQSGETTTAGGLSNIFGQTVNSDNVRVKMGEYARSEYGDVMVDVSKLSQEWLDANGNPTSGQVPLKDVISAQNVNDKVLTTPMIRDLLTYAELKKSGVSGGHLENVDASMRTVLDRVNENRIINGDLRKAEDAASEGWPRALELAAGNQQERAMSIGRATPSILSQAGFSGDVSHVASVVVAGGVVADRRGETTADFESGNYILGLNEYDSRRGKYNVLEIWHKDSGTKLDSTETKQFLSHYGVGNIKDEGRVSLSNEIADADRTCHFYETEPYRGMPAVIPFDVRNGWYAATRQTLPVFGGIGAFDASGRVSSFWLCNVGENKRVEFESGFGDDLCQQINLNTGQPLSYFPGLSQSQAQQKVNQAVSAIQDAARQYPNNYITINGERCEVGQPSVGQPGTQCQDFMSPTDCHLLFNVCDPVICPNSRCNFGGKFNVANVAQTGIVGSALLCLPNIQEGIVIPVCLTGIQAGIDGWVSIMRNYRDCLQENLETGETVGICDQIHSIYLCEFFWGQVAPFVSVLIPKLIEVAYGGQGTRGGGEYLTVQSAWQNMENSINYFTNSYAANSLQAFQVRTTGQYGNYLTSTGAIAEIGTEVCQNWISVKAPKAFEALIEPDSPPQFHAWFDEKTYTTATVPATSQYKVFYHIFAGNDAGSQFMVYLKNPPESSYYSTNPTVTVASGFVARGEYASETRDFTAPAGYKELCVRVNAEEECGFGQVTTSFALDALRDAYISGELQKTDITTERDCVAGSPSAGSLLTPNVQAGVEDIVSPAIYNKGVVRICSSENPGKSTNPSRFVNRGYCGDTKIGCWLDKQSVDRALSDGNVGAREDTLEALEDQVYSFLESQNETLSEATALSELDELEREMRILANSEDVVTDGNVLLNKADNLWTGLFFNSHKAWLLLIRGQINGIVARELKVVDDANALEDDSSGGVGDGFVGEEEFVGPPSPAGACEIIGSYWVDELGPVYQVQEGDLVKMRVEGSAECVGETVELKVVEDDLSGDDDVFVGEISDESAIFDSRGIAEGSWVVRYVKDLFGTPEVKFLTRLVGEPDWSGGSNNLKVDESESSGDCTVEVQEILLEDGVVKLNGEETAVKLQGNEIVVEDDQGIVILQKEVEDIQKLSEELHKFTNDRMGQLGEKTESAVNGLAESIRRSNSLVEGKIFEIVKERCKIPEVETGKFLGYELGGLDKEGFREVLRAGLSTNVFVKSVGNSGNVYLGRPPEGRLVGSLGTSGRFNIPDTQGNEHLIVLNGLFYSDLENQ